MKCREAPADPAMRRVNQAFDRLESAKSERPPVPAGYRRGDP
jgi:hypothetical protein